MYSKNDLITQMKEMGITPSDTVVIHTSMRAIGQVEHGADGIIDAFRDYLSNGLLIVPTLCWECVNREHPVYDVRTSVPCIGTLPKAAAFRKDGIRSLNPVHSMWVTGKGASEYIKNEEFVTSPGMPGGAWDRLAEKNAKILLIGVGLEKNTFFHSVEESANIPDRLREELYEVTIYDWHGNTYRHMYTEYYCRKSMDVSRQYVNFEKPLVELGAETFGTFGDAKVRIVDAKRCKEILHKIYSRTDKDLCIELMDIPEELYR